MARWLAWTLLMALACGQAELDPAQAGRDYRVQGEYRATDPALAAQVRALGDGAFELVWLTRGLPGELALPPQPGGGIDSRTVLAGQRRGERVYFAGSGLEATWADGRIQGLVSTGQPVGVEPVGVEPIGVEGVDLARVERASRTLGSPPPPGAIILFDATTNAFDGTRDERGWLKAGATSHALFSDFELHLEFRTPFMPRSRGQARGNSGVYLQGRYEIQVLDSFAQAGAMNECGAIYEFARPDLHMALPPLSWQTYDLDFRAARFDEAGSKLEPARLSLLHNGVKVHDDVAMPGPTGLGAAETREPGKLYLQDHWNPVVYRNIWLIDRSRSR